MGRQQGQIKCFFLTPTDNVRLMMRRYVSSDRSKCPKHFCHNAIRLLGDAPAIWTDRSGRHSLDVRPEKFGKKDARWPTKCDHCDYEFSHRRDPFQVTQDLIYTRLDTGEMVTLRDAPVGAMWYCDWMCSEGSNRWRGPDGHSLCVRIPGDGGHYDWMVDGRCNNCTMPGDDVHRCWVRTGEPPNITVGKGSKGQSCAAGAGSIQVPGWHGFLRNGMLVA